MVYYVAILPCGGGAGYRMGHWQPIEQSSSDMHKEDYQTTFQRLLAPQTQLAVAFSGGMDSTVLLHMLAQGEPGQSHGWAGRLRAIHIHHGISPFADSWQQHCQAVCDAWRVPLQVVRVCLQDNGEGLEAQARQARYAAFARVLQPAEALVCAHHLDDQGETLLLALKRGSGPAGLAGMPESLPFAGSVMLRPLLHTSRAELARYARRHQLSWIEDESNQDQRFDRNFLRQRVLPLLAQRWQHLPAALARSAQLCGEQEQLLDELLAGELAQVVSADGALSIAPLLSMSAAHRAALLRRWLARQGARAPSRDLLSRLWQEVALCRRDANPRLRMGDHEVRRYQQALWWVASRPVLADLRVNWLAPFAPLLLPQGAGCLRFADTGTAIRPPDAHETVSVRFRAPGSWHIAGRAGGRSLKKIWQELLLPPWLRGSIPLLFYNEQLIAAPGWFVCREGLPVSMAVCWHIHWQSGE